MTGEDRTRRDERRRGGSPPPLRLARWAIAHPWRSLAVTALLVAAAAPGLARLTLRTDGHALVPEGDATSRFDAEVKERFGLRDPIVILVETFHPDGIYNLDTLLAVQRISDALAAHPAVGKHAVTSLATERRDRVFPGTLNFRPYLNPIPDTPRLMEVLRGDVAAAGILYGTLVSADETATAVLVGAPPSGAYDRTALYREILAAVAPFESERDHIRVVGAPVAESLLGTHILEDLALLLPLAVAVIAVVVWLGCRRLAGVGLALAEVGCCLVFTFGLMGWLGIPVYLTTAVLPVILTTLGLADEIHIFWHYQRLLAEEGGDGKRSAAVERTFEAMARPVFLTSMTTGLAFLSFLSSEIDPVRFFGLFAAVGIAFCLLFSLTAVPAVLALVPRERMRHPRLAASPSRRWLGPLTAPLLRRRGATLAVLALLTAGLGLGLARLHVQDSWIDGFAPESVFYRDTRRVNQLLHGTHVLQVHLAFTPPPELMGEVRDRRAPLLSPVLLEAIGEFESFLRRQPGVGGVLGTHSHLTTVAYLWLGRKPEARRIPEEPERIDLVLKRFAMGRGEHRLREVIDEDLSRTLVTIFLEDANYRDTARLMAAVRAYGEEHLAPLGARLDFAGDVAVSQAMIPAIVRTQVTSLLLALAGAFLVVSSLYRSPRTGLLAIAPASVAVLWVFGFMGWAGIALGVATSMFCAITLGVGVDYAIHFLERWRWRREQRHPAPVPAAIADAGPAILADAAAIALGFGLLVFSQVPANARLGLLVALALVAGALLTLGGLGPLLHRQAAIAPAAAAGAAAAGRAEAG